MNKYEDFVQELQKSFEYKRGDAEKFSAPPASPNLQADGLRSDILVSANGSD